MTHTMCTESLVSDSERDGKCLFGYLVLDKYYEKLISLHMESISPSYQLEFHRCQKYVKAFRNYRKK